MSCIELNNHDGAIGVGVRSCSSITSIQMNNGNGRVGERDSYNMMIFIQSIPR